MICSGYYIEISGNKDEKFNVIYKSEGKDVIIYLGKDNNIVSAYKIKDNVKYAFNNKLAEKVYGVIKNGIQGATAKNGTPVPFKYGAASMHYFKKHSIDYEVEKFNGEMVHIAISDKRFNLNLDFYEGDFKEAELSYVKIENESITNINVDDVPVRSLEEIALEKDISWLKDKKYYVVNDNATAEALFSQLEKYKGIIAVDYETTGLKINMFGQYGSKRRAELEKYNLEHPDSPIKTDSVVGIIFCVEEGVSYYFPVGHRKFDNLYSKRDEVCIKTIKNIKARYTVGDHRDDFSEYGVFIRNLPESDFTPDIILMERIRDILEKCNMLAHNGSFEYKVSLLYNIDLNLKEDTMLMHQLMYKFRSTTSNKGEPSNLKYLTKVEFNIEQLSLEDFFANYKEDNKGTVRNSKASTIDFSYMDYKGTKAYGPADGDFTLALYRIYKKDLKTKYKDMEYIYNVEVIVAMAIGYMEFYGLRIDEEKIEQANTRSLNDMLLLEHRIRKIANYSSENEDKIYASLLEAKEANNLEKESSLLASLRAEIDASENVLNLNSPAQVSSLFYDILKYPCKDGDRSVGKKVIKSLTKAKDKDGSPKYPAVGLYREYKDLSSLVTKFFGKLPDFMYPGGFFFSSFGQISTATGRMSCSRPNSQQLPKSVTKIIVPRDNYIEIDADFSQIEYRTMTALAMEAHLIEQFRDPDSDFHTIMASVMYQVPYASVTPEMRSSAKSFNFGIPYGMGLKSLSILLFGDSTQEHVEKAKELYELYFKDQQNIRKFFDRAKETASVYKFNKTYFNRVRAYSFVDAEGNFSEAKKAMALRQAGNFIIQGSSADIFKIAVARNFSFIRRNKLFGKILITNMVHDEMLFEVDCNCINVKKALAEIIKNMEFKLEGFPPLYVGAGVNMSWASAKGKMSEIHPVLANTFIDEAENLSIYSDKTAKNTDIQEYFNDRVYQFRVNKIIDYLKDENNHNKEISPIIGNLLSLQFDYGVNKEFDSKYTEENGYSKEEIEMHKKNIPLEQLKRFIADKKVDIDPNLFKGATIEIEKDKDVAYSDEDDLDVDEFENESNHIFALIEEDTSKYGISIQDLIKEFGLFVSVEMSICGIDLKKVSKSKKEDLYKMLEEHECNFDDEGSLQVVFLGANNNLIRTDVYVNNLTTVDVADRLHINTLIA